MFRYYTVIPNGAVCQNWRTWSQDLATPPKVFLIESVDHILGLVLLMIDVKLSWPQMQFHGIFLIFSMEWRMASSSWGASFIPCFSWGINWLSLFRRLTSAYRKNNFFSLSWRLPVPIQGDTFFLIEDFWFFFSFLDVLASVFCDVNEFPIFFYLDVCHSFCRYSSIFALFTNSILA